MAAHLPQLNYRVLVVFVIVGILSLAVGSVVVLGIGQARQRTAHGLNLGQVAQHTAAVVDAYMFRRIIDASILARVPSVREAAAEGSAQPLEVATVRAVDQEWQQKPASNAVFEKMMTTPASRFLEDIVSHDPVYREILLTDRQGRLVAASGSTSDYYQADEAWWSETFYDGRRGRVSVSDVRWDDSSRVYALEIAVPVSAPTAEGVAGVIKIAADIRELLAAVAGVQMGVTGEAVLLRDDGSIVLSRHPMSGDTKFFAADLLRERLQAARELDPQFRTYFAARASDGSRHLIGIAPSQLRTSYPQLPWLVAVMQSEEELFAPTQAQAFSLFLVLGLTALAVIALAFWFSQRLAAHPVEIDMHLVEHAKIHRLDEAEERS